MSIMFILSKVEVAGSRLEVPFSIRIHTFPGKIVNFPFAGSFGPEGIGIIKVMIVQYHLSNTCECCTGHFMS